MDILGLGADFLCVVCVRKVQVGCQIDIVGSDTWTDTLIFWMPFLMLPLLSRARYEQRERKKKDSLLLSPFSCVPFLACMYVSIVVGRHNAISLRGCQFFYEFTATTVKRKARVLFRFARLSSLLRWGDAYSNCSTVSSVNGRLLRWGDAYSNCSAVSSVTVNKHIDGFMMSWVDCCGFDN